MSEFTAAPIGCLIMAAGNASRFGENKLTASFAGKSLFSLALLIEKNLCVLAKLPKSIPLPLVEQRRTSSCSDKSHQA